MKYFLCFVYLLFITNVFCQFYSWDSNIDPNWNSSIISNTTIGWHSDLNGVSTNNIGYGYSHNQNSTYTSNYLNLNLCETAINLSFDLNGELENNYDFLYLEYSNDGTTWNILQSFTGVQNNITYSQDIFCPTDIRYFRFRFQSDGSVNGYCSFWWFGCVIFNYYYYDISNFTLTFDQALPVELTDFYVKCIDNNSYIKWITQTETNSSHFILQSSTDGTNWKYLDSLPAQGNSINKIEYSVLNNINILTYYKLTQYDVNGKSNTYNVISNNCFEKTIRLYPNPNNGKFTLYIHSDINTNTDVKIINSINQIIYSNNYELTKHDNYIEINQQLVKGIYYLMVNDEYIKFVVQ